MFNLTEAGRDAGLFCACNLYGNIVYLNIIDVGGYLWQRIGLVQVLSIRGH